MSNPTVILAEHDVLIRDILRLACVRRGIEILDEVDTVDAMRTRAAELRPAVVISADSLGNEPIDSVLPDVLATGAKVVVVSGDPSPERLTALLADGVSGYLLHDASPEEVASGVFAVARGAAVLNPTAAATILAQWRRFRTESPLGRRRTTALTPRETDVLAALVEGLPTKGIAQRLSMAIKTVENHKIRIFDKLGVRTQAHAVTVAISSGLVRPAPVPSAAADPASADARPDPLSAPEFAPAP
jgi:DNA-binding NarL/FixJ family response regulator